MLSVYRFATFLWHLVPKSTAYAAPPLPSVQFPVSSADVMYYSVSSHNSLLWHTNEAIRQKDNYGIVALR